MDGKGKGKCQTSNPSFPSLQTQIFFGSFETEYVADPTQLPDPMPISSGSIGTEYEIHKKHVISDPNTSYSMTYYEGIIIHKGKDHEKHREDVCFLVRDTFDEAKRILNLSGAISHPWVMKASSFVFDVSLQQYLVCFDKFEGLENAKKENSFAKQLGDPKLSAMVPGNPGTFVQEEIKGLAEALDYMLRNNVSSSNLEWSYGYVWCPITSHVKIMLVDTLLEEEGNIRDEIIESHFMQFSKGLKKYFLKTSEDPSSDIIWPKREQFLNCFTRSKVPIVRRMKMVINHPFLKSNIREILEYIYMLSHGLNTDLHHGGHDLTNFKSKLKSSTRRKIRSIRNRFGHEVKKDKDTGKIYEDIDGRDPLFIGEIHEIEH